MLDIQLRPLKDAIFDPICNLIPFFITPIHLTFLGYLSGIGCFWCGAAYGNYTLALALWIFNRICDCLDGAVARKRNAVSELGGFLDLLSDFILYSMLPLCIALDADPSSEALKAVALLEISFHINNFILFYVAALAEKQKCSSGEKSAELTSVMMRPALIEGAESGIIFTIMLIFPGYIRILSLVMTGLVTIGIVQRTMWTVGALS